MAALQPAMGEKVLGLAQVALRAAVVIELVVVVVVAVAVLGIEKGQEQE
jgi:hypothetical protein